MAALIVPKFYVIINPASGAGRGGRNLRSVAEFTRTRGGSVLISKYPGHATALAKSVAAKGKLIFAAGGDDTIREVLQGSYNSKCIIGIIPLGTFNNLATSLYLPPHPIECLRLSLEGVNCPVDVGKIEKGKLFTESIGIGLDAHAWSKAPLQEPKGLQRWISGLKVGLSSLLDFTPQNYQFDVDGNCLKINDVLQITIANARCYCSGIQIAPNAQMNDGKLDICIVSRMSKLKFLAMAPIFYFGRHINSSTSVHYTQAHKITISGASRVPIRIDGMLSSSTLPLKATVISNSLTLRIPSKCRHTASLQ
ncbi:MAG: diacylglycerol/lipid kinase family protein [Candidatus Bruticola sp.]